MHDDSSYTLEHYGVSGMKWGVRKARPSSAPSSLRYKLDANKLARLTAKKNASAPGTRASQVATQKLADHRKAIASRSSKPTAYKQAVEKAAKEKLNAPKSNPMDKIKSKKTSNDASEQTFKVKASPKPSANTMSDSELRSVINRLDMERRYSELTSINTEQKAKSRGRQIVESVVFDSVKGVGTEYAKHVLTKGVQSVDPSFKLQKKKD